MVYNFELIYWFVGKCVLFLAVVIAVVGILLLKYQNKLLYMPEMLGVPRSQDYNGAGMQNPLQIGLDYEDINITTEDHINLHGWISKRSNAMNVPTVVYFHENAGNIGTRVYFMKEYNHQAQANIVLVAYRGYSKSEGEPNEEGIMLDAKAILTHIFSRSDIDTTRVFLHGRSLGGAVAVYSASELNFPIAGVILENTFTSIPDMVDVLFGKLSFMKKLVLRNYWPSISRISKIKQPILFIQAMRDELVPPAQMSKLYNAATSSRFKKIVFIL